MPKYSVTASVRYWVEKIIEADTEDAAIDLLYEGVPHDLRQHCFEYDGIYHIEVEGLEDQDKEQHNG